MLRGLAWLVTARIPSSGARVRMTTAPRSRRAVSPVLRPGARFDAAAVPRTPAPPRPPTPPTRLAPPLPLEGPVGGLSVHVKAHRHARPALAQIHQRRPQGRGRLKVVGRADDRGIGPADKGGAAAGRGAASRWPGTGLDTRPGAAGGVARG